MVAAGLAAAALAGCSSDYVEQVAIWEARGGSDPDILVVAVETCREAPYIQTLVQDASSVTVTIAVTRYKGYPRYDCTGDPVVVTLDAPLGSRDVIDGTNGRVVPVSPRDD